MSTSKFRKPSPDKAPPPSEFEIQEGEEEGGGGDAADGQPGEDKEAFEPLVLWQAGSDEDDHRISVDPRLCKWLRPHQREGVQFMFECGEAYWCSARK